MAHLPYFGPLDMNRVNKELQGPNETECSLGGGKFRSLCNIPSGPISLDSCRRKEFHLVPRDQIDYRNWLTIVHDSLYYGTADVLQLYGTVSNSAWTVGTFFTFNAAQYSLTMTQAGELQIHTCFVTNAQQGCTPIPWGVMKNNVIVDWTTGKYTSLRVEVGDVIKLVVNSQVPVGTLQLHSVANPIWQGFQDELNENNDTRSTSFGFTLSGLMAKLDSLAGNGGTSPGAVWTDLSGNNLHGTWPAGASGYTRFGFNNEDKMYFTYYTGDPPSYYCTGAASNAYGITNDSGYTIFMVYNAKQASNSFALKFEGTNGREISVHLPYSDGTIYFDQGGCCSASQRTQWAITPTAYIYNTWHTVALVRTTGAVNQRQIYYDGNLKITNTTTGAPLNFNSNPMYYVNRTGNWPAEVANILIYNRGLSAAEIASLHYTYYPSTLNYVNGTVPINIEDYAGGGSYTKPLDISGCVGWYKPEYWDGATTWTDVSNTGNHVTTSGPISIATIDGAQVLTGTTTSTLLWPVGVLPPTYTLFHVAKYNGTAKLRIMNGYDQNWLSGFWSGGRGVAYHNGWMTSTSSNVADTWVLSTDQNALYRANGADFTTGTAGNPSYARLSVNTSTVYSEPSDWAIAEIIIYNSTLSQTDCERMETYLRLKYSTLNIP